MTMSRTVKLLHVWPLAWTSHLTAAAAPRPTQKQTVANCCPSMMSVNVPSMLPAAAPPPKPPQPLAEPPVPPPPKKLNSVTHPPSPPPRPALPVGTGSDVCQQLVNVHLLSRCCLAHSLLGQRQQRSRRPGLRGDVPEGGEDRATGQQRSSSSSSSSRPPAPGRLRRYSSSVSNRAGCRPP
jgi:hypothetical protein